MSCASGATLPIAVYLVCSSVPEIEMCYILLRGGGSGGGTITSKFFLKQKTFTYQLNSLVIFKFLLTEFGFPGFSANEILPT